MSFKDDVKFYLNEMSFEIGKRKDGTYGYRSVVNGSMTDNTPPKNKEFIDAVMKVLEKKQTLHKLSKFDLDTVDVELLTNGGAKINTDGEDGEKISFVINPEEIRPFYKGAK